ncbi:MAG: hypothetical protein KJO11_12100 [Gemmatimonadetes bacterium]|nr:hypothetical protein [Gemmatimonadota bacterium]
MFYPRWLAVGAVVLLSASCGDEDGLVTPTDQADHRISITNDEGALSARVSYPEAPVVVEPPSEGQFAAPGRTISLAAQADPLELTLIAEVNPPTIDGTLVQATSVAIKGLDNAMVSYNMVGAPRLGGIDWITKLTRNRPAISASAAFNDTDVSALSMEGNFVYAAASTEPLEFPAPAVLERLKLRGNKFVLEDNLQVPLTSYVGTSSLVTNGEVYATSGDGGGLFAFDKNDLSLLGSYPLDDARWVTWDEEGGRIVVAQGTPGRLAVFAAGGSLTAPVVIDFDGADVPESKSTVEVLGGKAFIAAGPQGVQIVCLDDGSVLGSVPIPDPALLGLDPSVVVTNAVTVDEDVMFISNGEAGVYVARADEDFESSGCAQQQMTMLGKLRFDDLQSANHVSFKNQWLIVAAGLGGVKVVKVEGL